MMMSTVLRPAFRGLALGAALLLAACNGVGEGITPESSVLLPSGGKEGDTTLKAYTCLNSSLTLIVDFSNGARGDFTARAKWKSSKPDVVEVSNGDIAVPEQDGFFYGRGVLVVKKAGTAVISSEYLDFKNSITVTVSDPTNFKISPAEANIAIGASLDLGLTAELDGVSRSVDSFARWKFTGTAPAETVAVINASTGTVTSPFKGTSTAGTFMAAAYIPGCSLKNQANLDGSGEISLPGAVSRLSSLQMTKEFAGASQLVVNTTERYTAIGTLANGKTQDLTALATFAALKPADSDSSTDDENVFSDLATFLVGTTRNLLLATKVGTETGTDAASLAKNQAHLRASFSFKEPDSSAESGEKTTTITTDVAGTPGVRQISITPVAPTLSSLAISSSSTRLAPGNTLKLKAAGTYTASGSPDLVQDITRHVTWTPAVSTDVGGDTLIVQTSGSTAINPLAGLAVAGAQAETGKVVTVKASKVVSDTSTPSSTADITIDPDEPQESP